VQLTHKRTSGDQLGGREVPKRSSSQSVESFCSGILAASKGSARENQEILHRSRLNWRSEARSRAASCRTIDSGQPRVPQPESSQRRMGESSRKTITLAWWSARNPVLARAKGPRFSPRTCLGRYSAPCPKVQSPIGGNLAPKCHFFGRG